MKTSKFKMTELGPIPEEWECRKIGDLANVCTGNRNTQDKNDNGLYPFYVRSQIVERIDEYGFDTEGVITVGDGVGTGKVFHYVNGKFALHQRCYLVDSFDCQLNAKYFYKIFSERFFDRVMQMTAKSSVDSVRREMITGMVIPVPPLPEQERIAEALSDVDALLSAMTTLIEKKRAIKQGAMQELLGMRNAECGMRNVPRRRLAGFSGEWVEKRFDDCFELIGNNTYARECMRDDCDGLANIHYGDVLIRYGSVLDCSRTAVPSLIKSIICRTDRLSDGDVIIADTAEDETVGKAIEIRGLKGRRAVSGLHTIACRPRFDFAPGWLGYYINSSAFHDQLLPLITGTKVSSISKAGLRTTILKVPTLAEQQAIAAVLSDMDAEIAALEAKRAKCESIKQGMMQELLTGRTRLRKGN